ncbi:MAG: hypothetical protein RQ743_11945 [Bacteroidales bacterium]|nr:hypothetical protein [Bacteroidales bacterium]
MAGKLRDQAEVTVVTGIGGSYLGSKSVIESLGDCLQGDIKGLKHEILFAGQNISEDYHCRLMNYLRGKAFNIIVISKSDTTTEPAIAFRLLKKQLEENMKGNRVNEHNVAITDADKGALRKLADREAYKSFIIPDDVGGRYSVLTPAGLLPIAVAGYKIEELIRGAVEMSGETRDNNPTG